MLECSLWLYPGQSWIPPETEDSLPDWGGSFHFQKVLVDGHFFLSLSQRFSVWSRHLVLAVLSRTIGNLSPISVAFYVEMLQIFEQSWHTPSEMSPSRKLKSFMRLATLIGTCPRSLPTTYHFLSSGRASSKKPEGSVQLAANTLQVSHLLVRR